MTATMVDTPTPRTVSHPRVTHESIAGEREHDLVRRFQNGDRAAGGLLLEAHARLIWGLARRHRNRGVLVDDLYQEGQLGFLRAVGNFDASRGVKLATYAVPSVRWAIARCVVMQRSDIRVTRHGSERSPSEETREQARSAVVVQRLDAPIAEDGGTLADVLAADGMTPEEHVIRAAERETARATVARVLPVLRGRQRDVFERAFLREPPESYQVIAAGYGVTREAIRVMAERALASVGRALRRERLTVVGNVVPMVGRVEPVVLADDPPRLRHVR